MFSATPRGTATVQQMSQINRLLEPPSATPWATRRHCRAADSRNPGEGLRLGVGFVAGQGQINSLNLRSCCVVAAVAGKERER